MLAKWILYTVLCGAIPILGRLAIFYLSDDKNFEALNPADIIAYGILLHIAMLNTLDNFWVANKKWITVVNGSAIFGIIIYTILFTLHTIKIATTDGKILIFSIACIISSLVLAILIQILLTRDMIKDKGGQENA